jgi:transcriptional regulator of arginine metabolism
MHLIRPISRLNRQGVILDLLRQGPLASQDELRRELDKRGFRVTQATLSRDIHKLGLVKVPQGYTLPQAVGAATARAPAPGLERLLREFVREVREAQNLLVVRTAVGTAQSVAVAWDAAAWPELVGTVAGDDTILVICPDKKTAHKVAVRIRELLA